MEPTGSYHAYVLNQLIRESRHGREIWQVTVVLKRERESEGATWIDSGRRCTIKRHHMRDIALHQGLPHNPLKDIAVKQHLCNHLNAENNLGHITDENRHQRAEVLMNKSNVIMPYESLTDDEYLYDITPFCVGRHF